MKNLSASLTPIGAVLLMGLLRVSVTRDLW